MVSIDLLLLSMFLSVLNSLSRLLPFHYFLSLLQVANVSLWPFLESEIPPIDLYLPDIDIFSFYILQLIL
uniref:Putative secreted protein n=1 Tax=Panstrongylus lignarius TaxID=156445 RepID=A0A224Y6R5_9HEMI